MCVYIYVFMCLYVCVCMCVHACVCMHVCTGVCVYVCEHTCVMCTFPGIGHPTQCKSILLSWQIVFNPGACFCWKFCGLTPFLWGAWACPRCPAHILSQHDRLQKKQGQSDRDRKHCSLQRPSADSLRCQTSGD